MYQDTSRPVPPLGPQPVQTPGPAFVPITGDSFNVMSRPAGQNTSASVTIAPTTGELDDILTNWRVGHMLYINYRGQCLRFSLISGIRECAPEDAKWVEPTPPPPEPQCSTPDPQPCCSRPKPKK